MARNSKRFLQTTLVFLGTLLMLILMLGVWAWSGEVEESITASGQMVPEGKLQRVMAPVGGVVADIHVSENQRVTKGDVLMALDMAPTDIEQDTLMVQLKQLQDEMRALRSAQGGEQLALSASSYGNLQGAWLSATRQAMASDLASARTRIERLSHEYQEARAKRKQLEATLAQSEEMLGSYEALYEAGGLARNELTKYRQEVLEQRGALEAQREQVAARKLALEEARLMPDKLSGTYRQQFLERMSELEQRAALLERDIEKNALTRRRQQIVAPMDGVVHELAVRGEEEVVSSGAVLVSMVPDSSGLVAEVKVPNRDLAYVRIGQRAALSLEAFPYQQFGRLEGQVVSISPSTLQDEQGNLYYLVRIAPERQTMRRDGRSYPIRSGMTLTADLITQEKSILRILTEPVMHRLDRALRDPSTR